MHRTETDLNRRSAIAALGLLGVGTLAGAQERRQPAAAQAGRRAGGRWGLTAEQVGWDAASGQYKLPPLPYAPDALEPHIDAKTMEIHHGKHHQGYVNGLNAAIAKLAELRRAEEIDAAAVSRWTHQLEFNGGGHVNHTLFWLTMAPPSEGGGGRPEGALAEAIDRQFGSFDAFARQFKAAAQTVEGSGWGWLVYEPIADQLLITSMEKQQNQVLNGTTPLLGIDVWEHAYYLKYQNRRADYIEAFMNVVNWPRVGAFYEAARGA